jgi:hypothetical protein
LDDDGSPRIAGTRSGAGERRASRVQLPITSGSDGMAVGCRATPADPGVAARILENSRVASG